MIETKSIGLEEGRKIVDAMLEYSTTKEGRPMAHAVVDNAGLLVCFVAMDGASTLVRAMAQKKCYTAMAWKKDTREIIKQLKESKYKTKLVAFIPEWQAAILGGIPLKTSDNMIVGAVGSAGRLPEEDEEACLTGIKAFEEMIKV